jgi:ABC-2 type transport system permease protein
MIFWFALAFLINLLGQSSSQNAVSMLSLWVLFVLLIPAVVPQLGNSLYPVPSRAGLVNELRLITAEVNEKADDILSNFLRDHPELASEDEQAAGFWQRYLASQRVIQEEIRPVLNTYEEQLARQQEWTQKGKLLSPALLLQDSFNELSGTSNRHYEHFRSEVIRFAKDWRAFFTPLIFKNQAVDKNVMAALPAFTYTETSDQLSGFGNFLVILMYVLLMLGGGFVYFRRQGLESVLS